MASINLPLLRGKTLVIPRDKIVYVTTQDKMSLVAYENSKGKVEKKLVNKRFGELLEMLNSKSFYRSHKSYIVNVAHVRDYGEYPLQQIHLSTQVSIPLSRRKRKEFHNLYLEFIRKA